MKNKTVRSCAVPKGWAAVITAALWFSLSTPPPLAWAQPPAPVAGSPFSAAIPGVATVGEPLPPALRAGSGLLAEKGVEKQSLASRGGADAAVLDFCCGTAGPAVQRITVLPRAALAGRAAQALPAAGPSVFQTDAGLRLGMRMAAVRKRLGPPAASYAPPQVQQALETHAADCPRGGAQRLWLYASADPAHPLLARHRMPGYVQAYVFTGGRLTCMAFGFEPP